MNRSFYLKLALGYVGTWLAIVVIGCLWLLVRVHIPKVSFQLHPPLLYLWTLVASVACYEVVASDLAPRTKRVALSLHVLNVACVTHVSVLAFSLGDNVYGAVNVVVAIGLLIAMMYKTIKQALQGGAI